MDITSLAPSYNIYMYTNHAPMFEILMFLLFMHGPHIVTSEGMSPSQVKVVPDKIDIKTIRISGKWDSFNITWGEAYVSYGNLTYDLLLQGVDNVSKEEITESNYVSVTEMKPYTKFNFTIKACTLHGCSVQVDKKFHTPEGIPTHPTRPRVFVTHKHPNVFSKRTIISVEFRWALPNEINGPLIEYEIQEGSNSPQSRKANRSRRFIIKRADANRKYTFRVRACTGECGPWSRKVEADTTVENPVPTLLTSTRDAIRFFDQDARNSMTYHTARNIQSLGFIAHEAKYYWLNSNGVILTMGGVEAPRKGSVEDNPAQVCKTPGGIGRSLAVDWVGRGLYWVVEKPGTTVNGILKYDLNQNNGQPVYILSQYTTLWKIAVNPYKKAIYWTGADETGRGRLKKCHTNGKNIRTLINRRNKKRKNKNRNRNRNRGRRGAVYENHNAVHDVMERDVEYEDFEDDYDDVTRDPNCSCDDEMSVTPIFVIDHTLKEKTEIYIVDQDSGHIVATDDEGCNCRMLVNGTDEAMDIGLPPDSMAVDHQRLYWYSQNNSVVNSVNKFTGDEFVSESTDSAGEVLDIMAYGEHLQPMPDARCLLVGNYSHKARLDSQTNITLRLDLVEWQNIEECENISMPSVKYQVFYRVANGAYDNTNCSDHMAHCDMKTTYSPDVTLSGLTPDTLYTIQIKASNHYTDKEGNYTLNMLGPSVKYMTKPGLPSAPRDLVVKPRTPLSVNVSWLSPEVPNGPLEGIPYRIEWRTYSGQDTHSSSHVVVQTNSVGLHKQQMDDNEEYYSYVVANLTQATNYFFRVLAFNREMTASNPSEETTLTTYQLPGEIFLLNNTETSITIGWKSPSDDSVVRHIFQYAMVSKNPEWQSKKLNIQETENNTQFNETFIDLKPGTEYAFRVRVMDQYFNTFEYPKAMIYRFSTLKTATNGKLAIILVSIFCSIVVIAVLALIILYMICVRYGSEKAKQLHIPGLRRIFDLELATLRELPRVQQQTSNALYAINIIPSDEEIADLPHFRRDQLTLTKFLGSGAFGEVFEGIARNILASESGETKVAVKTLRKGATDTEKEEFIKEALLMNNFKHEHILSLLGVCLDNDPQFIILELMEGGDLLSYLRSSRATPSMGAKLHLPDMVAVCVDVAKGCKYLEDMHFVHRDLAARNCLVSSKNLTNIVVKIGDFGLARDIYKNDYYRKEGEGLLPVRWMSPESLIDGVFTTPSDIWAFGVLQWEVLTLGQQPYPARTNIEVLNFVRGGGKLDRPDNCPDDLYQLMLKCWSFEPSHRPSFENILSQLELFKARTTDPNSEFSGKIPIGINGRVVLPPLGTAPFPPGTGSAESTTSQNETSTLLRRPLLYDSTSHSSDYLEPVVLRQDHKYLELLDDDSPEPTPHIKKVIHPTMPLPNPNSQTLEYADIAVSDPEEDFGSGSDISSLVQESIKLRKVNRSPGSHSRERVRLSPSSWERVRLSPSSRNKDTGIVSSGKVVYAQLPDSDDDSDDTDKGSVNYSDVFTNDKCSKPSRTLSPTELYRQKVQSRNQPRPPVVRAPMQEFAFDSAQADVRSKITGDTDLSKTDSHGCLPPTGKRAQNGLNGFKKSPRLKAGKNGIRNGTSRGDGFVQTKDKAKGVSNKK